jgi:superoxide reductase
MKVHGPEPEGKRKHTPVVEAPCKVKKGEWFEVKVIVGKDIAHPNTKEHWIEHVSLWAGDFLVARADFEQKELHQKLSLK